MTTNNSPKINIMMYIHGLHYGGAERMVASLCRNLDKNRFHVTVCWNKACGALGEELISQGYDVVGLPGINANRSPYFKFLTLKKLIKEKNIHILHTHDTGTLVDGAQCRLFGSKIKIVNTFHFGNYPHMEKRILIMEKIFCKLAHSLVPVGYEQAKTISKTYNIPLAKLKTIYNGIEIFEESPSTDLVEPYRSMESNPAIICSISTLTEQKGLPYLIDTAQNLKRNKVNCVLLIVGDGPLRDELEKKCKDLGLNDMVYFLGWVPNAAAKLLPIVDIFCQSSLWEANSIALLEAMAAGISIVTTEVGESIHVIEDGINGFIVKPRDPNALAQAIEKLVNNQQLRLDFSKRAQQDYNEKYTAEKMIFNYSQLYESLV
ncbi:MAG: glycosyltransferase family 4 protein [Candidatus Thiodiazotropha sp.]